MGQKVNPVGLRLGINRTWDSRWFAGDDYAKLLHEDIRLRERLRERLKGAGVSRVVIERPAKKPRVTIHAARPGVAFMYKSHWPKLVEGGTNANATTPERDADMAGAPTFHDNRVEIEPVYVAGRMAEASLATASRAR